MKKLPQSNAPTGMLQWVRELVSIVTKHDADIDTLKSQTAGSVAARVSTANVVRNLENKQSTQARAIFTGTVTISFTANVTGYGILTLPEGMFTATPNATVSYYGPYTGTLTGICINTTNTSSTQIEVAALSTVTTSRTFNVIVVEN